MKLISPIHQFEVRFTMLLNFSSQVSDIIASYAVLAKSIGLEDENSNLAKYSLGFEGYDIYISNDRILFRYEGNIDDLDKNNSFVDSIFFPLLKKIESVKNFGKITHYLLYTILIQEKFQYINKEEDIQNKEELIKYFSKNFLNTENIIDIIPEPSDVAIIIEKKENGKFLTIQSGPYYGLEDLSKRKITIQSTDLLSSLNILGYMADIKIFEYTSKVDFMKYKEFHKKAIDITTKLWD